jgi:hypothetical protein
MHSYMYPIPYPYPDGFPFGVYVGPYGAYWYWKTYPFPWRYVDDCWVYAEEVDSGAVQLKVTPNEAQVFVDGYYAGIVDDFDGIGQALELVAGPHRIEIRLEGYVPATFDVDVPPGQTITYRAELNRS